MKGTETPAIRISEWSTSELGVRAGGRVTAKRQTLAAARIGDREKFMAERQTGRNLFDE